MAGPQDIAGIILAGGLSRRMFPVGRSGASADAPLSPGRSGASADAPLSPGRSGASADTPGGDKGLLTLGSQTMIADVIDRLRRQVGPLAINANGDPQRFAALGLDVVPDTIAGFPGPLAGVLAGMLWTRARFPAVRHIATVSADAPFIPEDLVERMAAAVERRDNAIAIAQSAGELHPVIGLWPVALADDLDAALRAGLRKVLAWTDRHGTVPVPFEMIAAGAEMIDPFFNANTPDELAEARRLMALVEGNRR